MWIAQGFIQLPNGSNVTMEDVGARYFDILLSRSLFQDIVKDNRGKMIGCMMHDHIHEVACAISNDQSLRRHLIMDGKSVGDEVLLICQRRRTVCCSESLPFDNQDTITNFIYLRILIIRYRLITELSDTIAQLKHLKYLDISNSGTSELPKSIGLLYNLQILKLRWDIKLPTTFTKLVNLRHLEFDFDYNNQIKEMPKHLSRMTQLQTLPNFIIGYDHGRKIEELGPLKDLKGKLSLFFLERVKSKQEAMAANLVEKENMSELNFEWSIEREECNDGDLNVLEGLQPHKNLRSLSISYFAGQFLPNGVFVENLVEIQLWSCKRCETLPMLGQLSKLKVLQMRSLSGVKSIGDEFYGNYCESRTLFPKLKRLYVWKMDNLEQWKEIAALSNCTTFPHLENLTIGVCLKLTSIPNILVTHSQKLEVDTGSAGLYSNFQSPPLLQSLSISCCKCLIKLPNWLEVCSSLEDLWIDNSRDDISPPHLQNMSNLSSLGLKNFHNLPEGLGGIHNLKKLVVKGPMEGYDWSRFIASNSLEVLELHETGTNSLTQLPRQLEHLTALRSLSIESFNDVESLLEWLGNITSLKTLKLSQCRNLKSLPSKEAMSNLTNLAVVRCSQLEMDEGGVEREKVSHVPYVWVE